MSGLMTSSSFLSETSKARSISANGKVWVVDEADTADLAHDESSHLTFPSFAEP
jgi:hypothetical protein